ncbi:SMC-Scp complex subunit ScpB [Leptolyngbya sp. KIOST-1]|uniref:SMC-Scp complex subunit ScpB n=1 Tax=Leptolyngbya sp. KIOST-1 TaxID=1229172 RepID=UPI00298E5983|nr:SMC-Scp complex subunit ScpB [Leptolyngbya sp. KIOST-1]
MSTLATTIEAILYLKGQPLDIGKLAELARCDREDVEEGLIELMDEYAHRDGALEIVETVDGYCLQLKERFGLLHGRQPAGNLPGPLPYPLWHDGAGNRHPLYG